MDSIVDGIEVPISISTSSGVRYISRDTCMRALVNPPSGLEKIGAGQTIKGINIDPNIDGILYKKYQVTLCIRLIYGVKYEKDIKYVIKSNEDQITIYNLPSYLAVVLWARANIKLTPTMAKFQQDILAVVYKSVNTIRAILCIDSVVDNRAELIKESNFNVPAIDLSDYNIFKDNRIKPDDQSIHKDEIRKWSSIDRHLIDTYIYNLHINNVVTNHREYMKVKNFGPICAKVLTEILPLNIEMLQIKYLGKCVNICDIYMYGLEYILKL
jgi:hypothetical protein